MTETHRTRLVQAIAFAEVFINMAGHEMEGAPAEFREQAQEQLYAALRIIDQPEEA